MIKKLLFILTVLCASVVFSQEKSVNKLVASPNPFFNSTTITFNSTTQQEVLISVRNVLGKTVFTKKINAQKGLNELPFKRNDLSSGMYIYAIQTGNEVISKRFVIR
ncbi:putative secreted protein (Por secretion system target) [Tenacibaculum skagerrakense]|uniref:Putative secreted protein (Por secretion system target) n=1 Tax=Tenacibaculum skagerrakense TaxID=186571 RepID=A0A4R2NR91_9FLAO|nr:T9SS type A sorting domain-containing protein [Tenacibaculum skagerrakense]TCP24423.1 putative secreted protein (Por secretion system target) [Tenacibaculum skagerrakense]